MVFPWLLAVVEGGEWRPGIGDPTVVGWFTVFAYFAAAFACVREACWERAAVKRGELGTPLFWSILTTLLILLGLNKQLDLQTLVTIFGRRLARAFGLYDQRRIYQLVFIIGVAVVGVTVLALFAWIGRVQWRRNLIALAGIVVLFSFVVIRAASFHHVDVWLRLRMAGMRWNAILELGGIAIVAIGAYYASLSRSSTDDDV